MRGRSVTIRCICGGDFNIAATQISLPGAGVKELACPSCAGTWRLAWDPRLGEIRMLVPEQRHDPAEWGLRPRLSAAEIRLGDIWIESD